MLAMLLPITLPRAISVLPLIRGRDIDEKFRGRRPESHHGQADGRRRNIHSPRQPRGAIHEQVGALEQNDKPGQHQQGRNDH